jgi:leader peptidase (prepilin peptidase)/N-methyltransferase
MVDLPLRLWFVYIGLMIAGLLTGRLLRAAVRFHMEDEAKGFPDKPIAEILNALLYAAFFWRCGLSAETLIYMILGSVLLFIALVDYKTMLIPDWIVLLILAGGIILAFFQPDVSWLERVSGMLSAGLILFLIAFFSKGGLGGGDVKLMAAAGFLLGWKLTLWALLLGSVTGGVIGLAILATGRGRLKTAIPFGPFLAFGIISSILFGEQMIGWYWGLFR